MLAHDRNGEGPPLVLIHGLGSHRQVWEPALGPVRRHREVIALDLPGFGDSPIWRAPAPGRVPGSVAHLADLVADFLAEEGLDRPAVAGNSLGGGIALELGRRGLASAVTAFAPVGFWDDAGRRWCQTIVGAARGASRALDPALPRLVRAGAGRAALGAVFFGRPLRVSAADCLAAARALAAAPGFAEARDALTRLRPAAGPDDIPVTVAWGTRDLVLPQRSQARRARALLPKARHVTLAGCGHVPFADDPGRCAKLLTECQ